MLLRKKLVCFPRNTKPDFRAILFFSALILAILGFTYRRHFNLGEFNEISTPENSKESYGGNKPFVGSTRPKMLPEHIQNELFPLIGSFLYDDDIFMEATDLASPKDMELITLKVLLPTDADTLFMDGDFLFLTLLKMKGSKGLLKLH